MMISWECEQAFGAEKYYMGVYIQRSWAALLICGVLLLPLYLLATPLLTLLGQPSDVADLSGLLCMCMIPLHFSSLFKDSYRSNGLIAWFTLFGLILHVIVSWLFVYKLQFGAIRTTIAQNGL